ncbi:MAG: tetratricopeptide repeat protein [Vulcanimicrobiaceae bacterium]
MVGLISFLLAILTAAALDAPAQSSTPPPAAYRLVRFQLTGVDAQVADVIDHGLFLCYAYNEPEALTYFQQALARDPSAAMAYWGIAVANGPDLNFPFSHDRFLAGREAIRKAVSLESGVSARERMFIDALAVRYAGVSNTALSEAAYRDSMAYLVAAYPEDDDAAMLYAEAIMERTDLSAQWRGKAPDSDIRLLQSLIGTVLVRNPMHPMANHLQIHLYDSALDHSPALASADRLASLAMEPAAEHLAHMPAHAYIENGYFDKAMQASARAIALSEATPTQRYLWHDWDVGLRAGYNGASYVNATAFVLQSFPGSANQTQTIARALRARFNRWSEILADPASNRAERANAYAATGDGASAARELRAATSKNANAESWFLLEAKVALAQGRSDDALRSAQQALTKEGDDNGEMIPMEPARETLAHVYYAMGRYDDAARTFADNLRLYPNQGRSLFGLWQSLEAEGKTQDEQTAKQQFERAWSAGDPLSMNDL